MKIHSVSKWERKPKYDGKRQEMYQVSFTGDDGVHQTRHLTLAQYLLLKGEKS